MNPADRCMYETRHVDASLVGALVSAISHLVIALSAQPAPSDCTLVPAACSICVPFMHRDCPVQVPNVFRTCPANHHGPAIKRNKTEHNGTDFLRGARKAARQLSLLASQPLAQCALVVAASRVVNVRAGGSAYHGPCAQSPPVCRQTPGLILCHGVALS